MNKFKENQVSNLFEVSKPQKKLHCIYDIYKSYKNKVLKNPIATKDDTMARRMQDQNVFYNKHKLGFMKANTLTVKIV